MGDDERRWVSGAQTYIANCLEIVPPRLLDTKMVVDRRVPRGAGERLADTVRDVRQRVGVAVAF